MNHPVDDVGATALLDRLAAGLTDPQSPVGLVAAGRRLARRRSRRRVGAGLAAVVVAVAGIAVVPRLVGPDSAVPVPMVEPAVDVGLPQPPAGTRWAGLGRAVVAVPVEWGTGAYGCSGPLQDTVFVANPLPVDGFCIAPVDETASTLELVRVASSTPTTSAAGEPRISCEQPRGDAVCSGSLTSAADGVEFLLTTKGDDAAEVARRILDSFTVLPEGWTTVPWPPMPLYDDTAALLERADLALVLADERPRTYRPVETFPAPSTPVPVGTEVLVQERRSDPALAAQPSTSRPGATVALMSRAQSIASEGTYTLQSSDDLDDWSPVAPVFSTFTGDELGLRLATADLVTVPDVDAGLYRLCTTRAPTRLCTYLYVTP